MADQFESVPLDAAPRPGWGSYRAPSRKTLAQLDAPPELIRDDAQYVRRNDVPARYLGTTDINLVVKDAGATSAVAADCDATPFAVTRAGDTLNRLRLCVTRASK